MLSKTTDFTSLTAQDIMSGNPKLVSSDMMAIDALEVLEENGISQLLVEDNNIYKGVVHLHDLIKEGIL